MDFVQILRSKEDIGLSDIEDYVRHYVDHVVPQYLSYDSEACDSLHVEALAKELQQLLEEDDTLERRLPVMFVVWTNLISALARLDVYVGAVTMSKESQDVDQKDQEEQWAEAADGQCDEADGPPSPGVDTGASSGQQAAEVHDGRHDDRAR